MKIRRVFPCGRTDGQRDKTKVIDVFRNFENVPKNPTFCVRLLSHMPNLPADKIRPHRNIGMEKFLTKLLSVEILTATN
jgi:hypothetical protein